MSKKFNYSKQYNKPEQEPVVKTPVDTQPVQEPEVKPEVKPVDDTLQNPCKTGVVVGCDKLNVRKGPSKQTNPASIISKGTVVKIVEVVNEGWFKISTANDKINGYCMSEFIELR